MESQSESENIEYWKERAKYYEHKANEIQQELDEYTESSALLEKELEAEILQVEKQNKDLDQQNQRLKNDIDFLRNKLERCQVEMNDLENELQALKKEKDTQGVYIRELEQKNDDLERGQRVISESVTCIETMLNQAYERNAVLESEVDEIENLRVRLQRATDEARDLKQELNVLEKVPIHKKEDGSIIEPSVNGHVINPPTSNEGPLQQSITAPHKREINGNMLTPSSRVTAINIVGDLLRRVGLERFLCRECGKVKCSCDSAEVEQRPDDEQPAETNGICNISDDDIEFRRPRLQRQFSGPDNSDRLPPKPPLSQRASETPFQRSVSGENGKLRRSFAVRSREGLENLLNFSIKKK